MENRFSKYQMKRYVMREFELSEYRCHECDLIFTIDDSYLSEVEASDGKQSVMYYCPYCGTKTLVRL